MVHDIAESLDGGCERNEELANTAARHNNGKCPMHYLLLFPNAMRWLAWVCHTGERKYAYLNWRQGGKPDREYFDSAIRHLQQHFDGEMFEEESGCPHVAHALWNLAAYLDLNFEKPAPSMETDAMRGVKNVSSN